MFVQHAEIVAVFTIILKEMQKTDGFFTDTRFGGGEKFHSNRQTLSQIQLNEIFC